MIQWSEKKKKKKKVNDSTVRIRPAITIAVDLGRKATKQTKSMVRNAEGHGPVSWHYGAKIIYITSSSPA